MQEGLPALLLACAALCAGCRREENLSRTFVLREHVNRAWTNELLSYPVEFPEGVCRADAVRLQGPDGPVPVQLADIVHWPDRESVRSARLCLVADLAPLETREYSATFGRQAAGGAQAAGDLAVELRREYLEATTSRFGARLRLGGEDYPAPRPAADVPGPLMAFRRADGLWFGNSRLFGETRVTAWSAEVTGRGPVFAEVGYRYRYEDGNEAVLTARLHAGAAGVEWESHVVQDRPDDGFDLTLSEGLPPLTLVIQREAYADRPEMQEAAWSDWVEIPLAVYEGEKITSLSPWADWWSTWTQTSIRLRMEGERELHLASRDAGAWVVPAAPGTMNSWNAWQHKLAPLMKDAGGAVFLRINNAAGTRKWSVEDRLEHRTGIPLL